MELPIGGFPVTRLSILRGVASPDPETRTRAFDSLVGAYWKPVYKYLRLKWRLPDEDAAPPASTIRPQPRLIGEGFPENVQHRERGSGNLRSAGAVYRGGFV